MITITKEPTKPKRYKTGEFLTRVGISRQTLYTYLTMGLIEEAELTESGRHLFDDQAVRRVEIIKQLNASGYPLRAIKEIYFKEGR
ncbi:MAG: MerR family transcriptional regulator [Planctomycetes bacterium]|nr:MerR family transcriptional regulator [Planctomycetota bacterium]